jgi:hypothetical protein
VRASVALALLEAVRDHDQPGEVLDDENVSLTLPRRFGLSGVVDTQIRRYRQEARRGRRIPEPEIRDLIRLVVRRPDAERVFHEVGRSLRSPVGAPRWRRVLPDRLKLNLARKRVSRRLKGVFGGRFVTAPRGPFQLESVDGLLIEWDPGGNACALVSGLSEAVIEAYGSAPKRVVHVSCRAHGGHTCRWELQEPLSVERGESDEKDEIADPNGPRLEDLGDDGVRKVANDG